MSLGKDNPSTEQTHTTGIRLEEKKNALHKVNEE